ncbi:MAG: SCO6745 family protein [Dehalococcoidia bacterium]
MPESLEATTGPALPRPVRDARPARRLRDAFEPIAMHNIGSAAILARAGAPGLDFAAGYVWGRAAPMGELAAEVVVAAFGVFEPGLISAAYRRGREAVGREALLEAQAEVTAGTLRAVLGDIDVSPAVTALRRGVEAADGTARALFSGLRSLPWPTDPAAQLWRACNLLREHRGDSHLAASISAGLGPVAMNIVTELWLGMPLGPYTATRGWSEPQVAAAVRDLEQRGLVAAGALTAAGRQLRDTIEERTDAMERPVVEAIGDDFESIVAQLQEWSNLCIAAKTFTSDVYKRAAG